MPTSEFETELKNYYEQKRQSQLTTKIGQAAGLMRETLLLCAVYDEVYEGMITPEGSTRDDVETLRSHVRNSEFNAIESKIEGTLADLEEERDKVREELQISLRDTEDRIKGFRSLNKRICEIDEKRINNLFQTIGGLNDAPPDEGREFGQLESEVREAASEFVQELEAVEDDLFQGFRGSDIEEQVRSLLRGETMHLTQPERNELNALRESQLGPYLTLSLEGE
ncbi:hypothetical protein [Natronobiforma cellulositropha]|uniref:hypothetical protein n=1 Tax=Natronobiforma cellulositropha TaxID=1679076 RepID=UPI0021D5AD7D|nr:hypothetical protein [Natronobiforma cellulositropha]